VQDTRLISMIGNKVETLTPVQTMNDRARRHMTSVFLKHAPMSFSYYNSSDGHPVFFNKFTVIPPFTTTTTTTTAPTIVSPSTPPLIFDLTSLPPPISEPILVVCVGLSEEMIMYKRVIGNMGRYNVYRSKRNTVSKILRIHQKSNNRNHFKHSNPLLSSQVTMILV
jgi:hypothetical protein